MLAVYFGSGLRTFDMVALANISPGFSKDFQFAFFMPMFIGFAVLAGMFPFHTWSPTGHVAAPTAVSMLHAGVLMKLGAFGCLRAAIWLMPMGAQMWAPVIITLTLVNVVYGAYIAMAQRDMKYMIGYSSVSHMGFVVMGLAALNEISMDGAVLQMFAHGVMTALFFAVVGRMIYDRTHTRQLPELGGLAYVFPFAAFCFILGGFSSMGMPGYGRLLCRVQYLSRGLAALPAGSHPGRYLDPDHGRLYSARRAAGLLRRDQRSGVLPAAQADLAGIHGRGDTGAADPDPGLVSRPDSAADQPEPGAGGATARHRA